MAQVGVDSYTLRMIEQVTGPLRKIEEQMERVTGSMEKLQQLSLAVFAGGAVVAGIGLIGRAIGGLVSIMSSGVGIAERFLGTILEVAKFRTQNITALDTFLGGGRGKGVFNRALDVGGMTPADELEVVKQVKALAAAGYKGAGLNQANAALLDVHAMLGEENRGNLQYYFQKFIGGRKVEADDLRMASFSAGLQETDVMRRVLQTMGVVPSGDAGAMGKQFDKLKKDGKVTGRTVVKALLQGINERMDEGGGLGGAAKKMGEGTLAGMMSNLQAAPMRFLAQMELEKLPGVQTLMEFLKKLLVFFDHATPQGKKLAKVVEDITNTLLGGLSKVTSKDLERFFDGALNVAREVSAVLTGAWDTVDKMMHGDMGSFATAFGKSLIDVGVLIGKGMWEGLWAATQGGDAALPSGWVEEVGGQAIRAGDLSAIAVQASQMPGGLKAAVEYLTGRSDLSPFLADQVATARQRLGLNGVNNIGGLIDDFNKREAADTQTFEADVIDVRAPRVHHHGDVSVTVKTVQDANDFLDQMFRSRSRVGAKHGGKKR